MRENRASILLSSKFFWSKTEDKNEMQNESKFAEWHRMKVKIEINWFSVTNKFKKVEKYWKFKNWKKCAEQYMVRTIQKQNENDFELQTQTNGKLNSNLRIPTLTFEIWTWLMVKLKENINWNSFIQSLIWLCLKNWHKSTNSISKFKQIVDRTVKRSGRFLQSQLLYIDIGNYQKSEVRIFCLLHTRQSSWIIKQKHWAVALYVDARSGNNTCSIQKTHHPNHHMYDFVQWTN